MARSSDTAFPDAGRFSRFEDPGTDFPFYNGQPVAISWSQWLFVLAMVVAGFLAVVLPIHWPGGLFGQFIPAVLMFALPLGALALVTPEHWTSIFGTVSGREIKRMFLFALLNFAVTMGVGWAVRALVGVAPNGLSVEMAGLDPVGRVAVFAKTIPQLFGEEVFTILPFLALISLFSRGLGAGRKTALVAAWLISAVFFGLVHLPSYDWNLIQCLVVIGTARLMLTLAWIMTKNIWVSTGAHIINDWLLLSMGLLGNILLGKL
jgi:uncharacterized protein